MLEQKVLKKTFFINHFEKKLYIYFWKSGYGSRGFRNSITPMFCWWWPQQFTINKLCFKSIFKVLIFLKYKQYFNLMTLQIFEIKKEITFFQFSEICLFWNWSCSLCHFDKLPLYWEIVTIIIIINTSIFLY